MATSPTQPETERPSRPLLWLIPPARGWRRKPGGMFSDELSRPLIAVGVLLILAVAAGAVGLMRAGDADLPFFVIQFVLLICGLAVLVTLFLRLRTRLLDPLAQLRNWALRMRAGNLTARIPLPQQGEFTSLVRDINSLADQLQILSRNMNAQVRAQTARISNKTRSLEILYEVVASLNTSRNRDELLAYFLETLVELLDADAANLGLFGANRELHTAAVDGNMEGILTHWGLQNVNRTLCNEVASEGRMKIYKVLTNNVERNPAVNQPELIVVPIQYRGLILGVYTLFLQQSSADFGDDFRDLLTSVGRHVGLALEKSRLDENARRLAIMEERDILRNELHDSLAQSLVSMRLQVKMLGETLYKKNIRLAQNEVRQLHMALEEAHTSLREMLASFRSRMDDRGLIPAIEDAVERFQQDTGIATFFQHNCSELNLSPTQEVEVFRIVQEALANIRRHSQAQTARVFLGETADANYRLLVEDDGVGLNGSRGGDQPGDHFGLAIMRERAQRLQGRLTLESEPGDGTRVILNFANNKTVQVTA